MNPRFKDLIEKYPTESSLKLVYMHLYREIISLQMRPGVKLNLAKLANELNVSRTTVRDAVLMLQDERFLEKTADNKFTVSELNTVEIVELYAARKIIESGAAQMLCEHISGDQIAIFHGILRGMAEADEASDYDRSSKLDLQFHKNIIDFCGNKFIISMYGQISDQITRYMNYTNFIDYPLESSLSFISRQHTMIVHSLEHGMPENVAYMLHKHLADAEKLLLNPGYPLSIKKE